MKKLAKHYYQRLRNGETTRHSIQNMKNYYKAKSDKLSEYLALNEALAIYDFEEMHNISVVK